MQFGSTNQLVFLSANIQKKQLELINYQLKHKYSNPSSTQKAFVGQIALRDQKCDFCCALKLAHRQRCWVAAFWLVFSCQNFSSWILSCCLRQSQQLHLSVMSFVILTKLNQHLDHRNTRLKVTLTTSNWLEDKKLSMHPSYRLKWKGGVAVGGVGRKSKLGPARKKSSCHSRLLVSMCLSGNQQGS